MNASKQNNKDKTTNAKIFKRRSCCGKMDFEQELKKRHVINSRVR